MAPGDACGRIVAVWEAPRSGRGCSPSGAVKHTVPLALGSLERDLYGNGLTDPTRYDEVYERERLVELVERRIEEDHREEIREVFKMLRQGYTWDEIATRLHDRKPERQLKKLILAVDQTKLPAKNSTEALTSRKAYAIITGGHEGRNTATEVGSPATRVPKGGAGFVPQPRTARLPRIGSSAGSRGSVGAVRGHRGGPTVEACDPLRAVLSGVSRFA